jgi:diguanylate cyclase (GGDEF)-like protein
MRKFVVIIFSLYIAVAVFVSLIHIFFEYRNIRDQIYIDLESIYISSSEPLSTALWSLDVEQVENLIDGLLTLNFISAVEITDNSDDLGLIKGNIGDRGAIAFQSPISYIDNKDTAHYLGEIKIASSQSVVFDRIKVNILFIVINAFIKTFFLSAIILVIGRKIIGRPLEELSESVSRLDFESVDNIEHSKIDMPDLEDDKNELTELMFAYNQTLDKLAARTMQRDKARTELEDKNINLEKLVNEKTLALQDKVSELSQLNEKLDIAASTDFLTGAVNRRSFFERSEVELNRLKREDKNACVVMLDVDFFKAINDKYGHAAGDAVLVFIVDVLKKEIRQHDIVARLGGEEFVVLLIDVDLDQAKMLAERLRCAIESGDIVSDESVIKVTASFGLAMVSSSSEDIHQAINKADELLYQAKNSGRNQVKH